MKQWMTVAEAAEVMGCTKRNAYLRLHAAAKRIGRPVLVKRNFKNRMRMVVSAEDIARLNGDNATMLILLEIKGTLEALVDCIEELGTRLSKSDRF